MHLIDPQFLFQFALNKAAELEYEDENGETCIDKEDEDKHHCYKAIQFISSFMKPDDKRVGLGRTYLQND